MIIDAHTHLNLFTDKNRTLQERLSDLKKFRKSAGINKTVVFATIKGVARDVLTTKQLVELLKNEKDIFVVAGISINYTKKDLDDLRKWLSQKKVVGIKFYTGYEPFYPSDKRCEKVFDLCEEFDVPVIFHTGETFETGAGLKYSHPFNVDEAAVKRPNLKIIIAHIGNPWIIDTMEITSRHSNVYADISGLVWKKFDSYQKEHFSKQVIHVIKWSEKNKLLFGTDWPCNDESTYSSFMKDYVNFVKNIKLPKKDKEKIFHLNAEKLFNL